MLTLCEALRAAHAGGGLRKLKELKLSYNQMGDGVMAAAAREAGGAVSRAIEGGVVRLGQATGEGEWLAARADGAAVGDEEEHVLVREAQLRRLPAPQARKRRAAAADHSPAALQAEALVVAAQRAYARGGDWRPKAMTALMRSMTPELGQVPDTELLAAVGAAQARWKQGAGGLRAVTLNHGGLVVRLREAVTASRKLRKDARQPEAEEMAALVWQADERLYRTVATLAADNAIVLMQETHISAGEEALQRQLHGLLTSGEFAQWKLEASPAAEGDDAAGVLTWYDASKVEVSEVAEMVAGRVLRAHVRVRADGTALDLVNAYMPARKGVPTAAERERLQATQDALRQAAADAEAAGRELVVGGDLNSQSARALSASHAAGNAYDAWLEAYMGEFCLTSVGEVEATYVAGVGGASTAIDHWLVSVATAEGAAAVVGAGADGVLLTTEGGAAAAGSTKGHNSLQLRIPLRTAAAEEAEEEWEKREPQVPPLDELEWVAYLEAEEAELAAAEAGVTTTGLGAGAARLEAMEASARSLAKLIKELGAKSGSQEAKVQRLYKKCLRWRAGLRKTDGHRSFPDTHAMFNSAGCAGAFGAAPELDAAFRKVVESSREGVERRVALREECRSRFLKAREEYDGEVAVGAWDADRCRTRLMQDLASAEASGGAGTWEIWRAVGRCKASLAGKGTRPRDGRPGMAAIRRTGETEPVQEPSAVLRALHDESLPMHQEVGASVAGVLRATQAMEEAGLPMLTPRAVLETRSGEEATAAAAAEATAATGEDGERAAWHSWRGEEGAGLTALEALDGPEFDALASALRRTMERTLTDAALEAGLRKFRQVQGVGVGGFSGVWVARASEGTRGRYLAALRSAAADVLAAASEMERATTTETRRAAVMAVRKAAPRGWVEWLVILLTKPGKALDVLCKRRDICLQPHSLKLLMNGFALAERRRERRSRRPTPASGRLAARLCQGWCWG